ncbi:2OG-Fe(II) oxygenase [Sulfuriferula thiophila]|uniref:2OG-Fe(II) oxygenase n=1 Tax=Sulfuriferula thiophila TaxID=1781211 RepID=UPI000F612174|nr:2OG-Fe(II) oxygenase [Sulfuriferula thiophila]
MNAHAASVLTDSASMLDLTAFNSAELNKSPYEYMVLPDFLKADALEAISRDFPVIKQAGSFPFDTLKCGPAFIELMHQLEGETFRHAVEKKFNVDLTGRPTMITVRGHTDETDGRIHTDSKTKIITMLIYFNEAWQKSGGRLRILRSGTDLEDYVAEVEPAIGTLLAFRRSDNSWHGHKPFVGERKALQLNWVLDEQVKRREQKRHGFSAFFKKLFGNKEYAG